MIKIISFSFISILIFCCDALAQPFPPAPSAAAPLDGFTFLLIAGGAAVAATQLKDKEK